MYGRNMTSDKDLVAYIGPYGFPNGGAAARRIYGNCLSLKNAGYDVVVASGQQPDGVPNEYNGFKVFSYKERRSESFPRLLKYALYLSSGKKAVKWLEGLEKKPAAVIIYSGYSPYLLRILSWSRKNKVKVIFDVVEWYYSPNFFSRWFSPYYINIELAMRLLIKKCDGIIVISEYLNEYYKKSVSNIIKVPPTVDCDNINPCFYNNKSCINLVYAGNPGTKDSLAVIVEAVIAVSAMGNKIKLHIAGVDSCNLINYFTTTGYEYNKLNEVVVCHGVLDHDSTLNLVKESHYSIIVRPDYRNVRAGFPTKFVESMVVGTPVIANITSDLGIYLENNFNGLVCSDSSLNTLIDVISECFKVENYTDMRANARSTAERYFDFSMYSDKFKQLIG